MRKVREFRPLANLGRREGSVETEGDQPGVGTSVGNKTRLQGFTQSHNFDRPHHGYRVRGRTPATIFPGALAAAR